MPASLPAEIFTAALHLCAGVTRGLRGEEPGHFPVVLWSGQAREVWFGFADTLRVCTCGICWLILVSVVSRVRPILAGGNRLASISSSFATLPTTSSIGQNRNLYDLLLQWMDDTFAPYTVKIDMDSLNGLTQRNRETDRTTLEGVLPAGYLRSSVTPFPLGSVSSVTSGLPDEPEPQLRLAAGGRT